MISLFSPAKINLFLRVIGKREDGYHNLSSVFQTLTLGDTLQVGYGEEEELTCSEPSLPTDGSNLVLKAAAIFRRKTGIQQKFKVHLIKRIPMQAGLGGGSSNAAAMLWACRQLCNPHIPLETLRSWGAEIGSDVPFFFSEGTAHCAGRGEVITPLPAPAPQSLWIVKPAEGLSTPEMFRRFKPNPENGDHFIEKDLRDYHSATITYFNDLETPAFEVLPRLKELKETLYRAGFEKVLMTGSGSAFFCMGAGIPPNDPTLGVFPVTFLNRRADDWYCLPQSVTST